MMAPRAAMLFHQFYLGCLAHASYIISAAALRRPPPVRT